MGRKNLVSLVEGLDENARRAYALTAANTVPGAAEKGHHTRSRQQIHIDVEMAEAGVTGQYTLWMRMDVSGKWVRHPNAIGIPFSGAEVSGSIVDISHRDRVYVQVHNLSGPIPGGVNVWLAGSNASWGL